MDDVDIVWDGHSHREIVDMVNAGPGASLTAVMEEHLKKVAGVLNDLSDEVNRVIQRTGEDWHGGAAGEATNAMVVLRGIDDGMHFTSNVAGIRAFGQSDSAGWVRANMPPVVEVNPPVPTGGLIDILDTSVDFQKQQAAAKEAEQRAREIMKQYTEATRERAAVMTPLAPVPQVVLDVSEPPVPPPIVGPPARPRDPGDGPRGRGAVQESDGEAGPGQPPPTQPDPTAPSVAPGPTQPAVTPGPGSAPITPGSPDRQVPGGSSAPAPPLAGGFANERSGGRSGLRPLSETPGRGGAPAGGRGPAGGPPGVAAQAGRGAAVARGAAGGLGAASPFGAGPGARREEDREHQARYGVPSAEHFEPDDPASDPHREGWHVAPQVIGDRDEDGDHQ